MHNKLKITGLLSTLLLVLFGFQKNKTTDVSPYPMSESSLLWKIEGNGIKKGSYLFGTMHLIEKDKFLFPKSLEKIIKSSDQIVMEIAGLPSPMEAMKYIMLKDGNFTDFFTDAQLDSIYTWSQEKMGMDKEKFLATFNGMKPFVVVQMGTQMEFVGNTESYEKTIEALAKENEITMLGLETIEQQMSLFDNMTKTQQAEMVMEIVRGDETKNDLTEKMQNMYVRQQIDSLYMMINEEGGIVKSEQKVLLDDRNTAWIPLIKNFVQDKKTFIAVGAGHLGGPDGVIRQLEKQGYKLTPVKLN